MIDAYMHVGEPRFGSAAEALASCDAWGIHKVVLVLGPGVPDIAALVEAQRARPERIRTIGIPYGETEERRLICAEVCWAAGVIGFRLQQDEPLDNPRLMDELGNRGGWAYATDPLLSERHTAFYLEWLDRYPEARIGASIPSLNSSVREISTWVSLRVGPSTRTRWTVPWGPMRSTRSSQAYCPGCSRSLRWVSS